MSEHKDNIQISRTTVWQIVSGILAVLFIVSVYTGGFGGKEPAQAGTAPVAAQPRAAPSQPSGPVLDAKSLIDDDSVKGDINAPVTIVEFSDYECPFCTRFFENTLPPIQSEYIDTGKVNFVYRDFPLNFHANAQKAAEAAECAGEQDKYFDMHDQLFEKGVAGGVSSFKGFAKEIGLDSAKFDQCLDSGKYASEVKADMAVGSQVGVTGTPGFIINSQLLVGAQPFSAFKQVIDAELAKVAQ